MMNSIKKWFYFINLISTPVIFMGWLPSSFPIMRANAGPAQILGYLTAQYCRCRQRSKSQDVQWILLPGKHVYNYSLGKSTRMEDWQASPLPFFFQLFKNKRKTSKCGGRENVGPFSNLFGSPMRILWIQVPSPPPSNKDTTWADKFKIIYYFPFSACGLLQMSPLLFYFLPISLFLSM